jgi:DNA-directed RNA polymerase subunit M/transcription elongation factor TFIIS
MEKVSHASRINAARFLWKWSQTSKAVQLLELLINAAESLSATQPNHVFHALVVHTTLYLDSAECSQDTGVEEIMGRVLTEAIGERAPQVSLTPNKTFNVDAVLGEFTGEAIFTCRNKECKSSNVTYVALQTRSADEDVKYFWKCKDCDATWKK